MSELRNSSHSRPGPQQFSLRAILLAICVLAILLSLWVSYRRSAEVQQLQAEIMARDQQIELHQAEVLQLKRERGELTIVASDRDKLIVVAAPSLESMMWKWRLYVPANKQFCLDSYTTTVNTTAMHRLDPSLRKTPPIVFKPGEITIAVALRKDAANNWQWIISYDGSETRHLLSKSESAWIERNSPTSMEEAGKNQQETIAASAPLKLFRYRSFPWSIQEDNGGKEAFGDGIVVWIRELKPIPATP